MNKVLLPLILAAGILNAEPADSLQSRLATRQQAFEETAPRELQEQFQEGIDSVASSGIYDRLLKYGEPAPDFTLKNAVGEPVSLSALLKEGPVVLTWYRGGWCPYCNITLHALQEKLPEIRKHGARLVALTPELPDHSLDTSRKQSLEFEVLSDVGNQVADRYGVSFKMTPEVASSMHEFAQTRERNGDDSDELPLAASYVIDQSGVIRYVFADADYRKRAEPARLVDALASLQGEPDSRHLLLQFWEATWNPPYDLGFIDHWMSEDFVLSRAGQELKGRAEFKRWVAEFQSKVGDLRLGSDDLFSSRNGKRLASRWHVNGRNQGFIEGEVDGREFQFTGVAIWEFREGKFTHNWVESSSPKVARETP